MPQRPVQICPNGSQGIGTLKKSTTSKNAFPTMSLPFCPEAHGRTNILFYMAHWDHLGLNPALKGDQIFNGALDNASGVAGLIELAKAFTKLPSPPERSIAFISTTSEEQGLLGSEYYAEHPIYPLTKTVAAINMDGTEYYTGK